MKKDMSQSLLGNGITDIILGAIWLFYGLWLSMQTNRCGVVRGAPTIMANGGYALFLLLIGGVSIAAGISCIIYRDTPKKYRMVLAEYVILSLVLLVFIFAAGIPAASFAGGIAWLFIFAPLSYFFSQFH